MSKQYINYHNQAPSPGFGTIALWYLVIKYFNLPDWSLGVWGLISVLLITNGLYRIITEDAVDVVNRKES